MVGKNKSDKWDIVCYSESKPQKKKKKKEKETMYKTLHALHANKVKTRHPLKQHPPESSSNPL
jgi:hypothetical protein